MSQFGKSYDLDVDVILEDEDKPLKGKMGSNASGAPANPMDAKIDGTPFSVLMNQAVKMKSADQARWAAAVEAYGKMKTAAQLICHFPFFPFSRFITKGFARSSMIGLDSTKIPSLLAKSC